MPVIGVVVIMAGIILTYLGFTGGTVGDLMRKIFGP